MADKQREFEGGSGAPVQNPAPYFNDPLLMGQSKRKHPQEIIEAEVKIQQEHIPASQNAPEAKEQNIQNQILHPGVLPQSVTEMLGLVLKNDSQEYKRKFLQELKAKSIPKTQLFPIEFIVSPFSPAPITVHGAESQIRYYISQEASCAPHQIYIKLFDGKYFSGHKQVVIYNEYGEILVSCIGYEIHELPTDVVKVVEKFASCVIIENYLPKRFLDHESSPRIIEVCKKFIWCEFHNPSTSEQFNERAREVGKRGCFSVHFKYFEMIFSFVSEYESELSSIWYKMSRLGQDVKRIVDAIDHQYYDLKSISYPFLPYIIMNYETILNKDRYIFQSGDLTIIVKKLIHLMENLIKDPLLQECQFPGHFPMMLSYPKFCLVCKKDNKLKSGEERRKTTKKTKYGCEGCSITFKIEVRLCIMCFKRFHNNASFYIDRQKKNKKKPSLPSLNFQQSCEIAPDYEGLLNKIKSVIRVSNFKEEGSTISELKNLIQSFEEQENSGNMLANDQSPQEME